MHIPMNEIKGMQKLYSTSYLFHDVDYFFVTELLFADGLPLGYYLGSFHFNIHVFIVDYVMIIDIRNAFVLYLAYELNDSQSFASFLLIE